MERLLKLSILGVAIGILVGSVVLGFQELIDAVRNLVFNVEADALEHTSSKLLIFAPIVGALVLDLLRRLLRVDGRNVCVVHVMYRLQEKTKKVTFPYTQCDTPVLWWCTRVRYRFFRWQ